MARILTIDDDVLMQRMLNECLKDEHDIMEAENGAQGIEIAFAYHPDLVICDLMMPDMNGFEVLDHFQNTELMADVPFIFLSGSTDDSTVRQGMRLGADDFLLKPFSVAELLHVVKIRLEKRSRRQAQAMKVVDDLRLNVTTSLPHELRTSIMILEGYAHLLLDDTNNIAHEQRDMLVAIKDNAIRLRHMSEKYLWYLKTQMKDRHHLNKTPTRLDKLIQSTANEAAQRVNRQSSMTLMLEPFTTLIEPEDFCKAVEEIVDNAFKFSKPGTPVTIFSLQQKETYTISVINFGHGFTLQQIQQIGGFMQFERRLYEQQGVGLGLVIAKRLAELCGGKLVIDSATSKTTVSIVLPYKPLH